MEDETEGGGGDSQLARGWKRVLREETVESNKEMDCIVQLLGCFMSCQAPACNPFPQRQCLRGRGRLLH